MANVFFEKRRMREFRTFGLTVALLASAKAVWAVPSEWPVVRHFDRDHLYRVALPMGGIGTGSVSLSGRVERLRRGKSSLRPREGRAQKEP